jgi:peptidoglycan-N-acetylglucosamine deacetylase
MQTPILLDLYPGAKRRAFTLSFDDGQIHDRRLVELFNQYALRATFNLNSGFLGQDLSHGKYVRPDEVKSLYAGHEVASHSITHPHLPHLASSEILREVLDDRRALESLVGYPVRGFAYPGCGFDDRVVSLLQTTGLTYARTCQPLPQFEFPNADFFRLGFTCSHAQAHPILEKFLATPPRWSTQAMIVMGHSFDFEKTGWENITALCKRASNQGTCWYPTTIELVDYTIARYQLQFSADGSIVHNPTATTIWATVDEKPIQITPGQTLQIT